MKRSLKTRLLVTVLTLIFTSNTVLGLVSIMIATGAMSPTVKSSIENLSDSVAVQFEEINNREFRMLNTLGSLNFIRDRDVSIEDKVNFISTSVSGIDKNYVIVSVFDLDGKSYDSNNNPIDLSSTEVYKNAMLGKKVITDPMFLDGNLVLMYGVPIFDNNHYICGGVYATVRAERMYGICGSLTIGKDSHPILVNMTNGIVIGHNQLEKIRNHTDIREDASPEFLQIVEDMCIGKSSWGTYKENGKRMLCAYRPVGSSCRWAVLCAAPYNDYFGSLRILIVFVIFMIVFTDVLAAVISVALIKKSLKPLFNVKNSINDIATGNADLTRRIKIESNDEIGEVVVGFNGFSEKLQSIISGVKESKELLSIAGDDLVCTIQDTSSNINDILNHIQIVYQEIEDQVKEVGVTSGSVESVVAKINNLKEMIENQTETVHVASTSVQEMIENISSVNNSMDHMAMSFSELITSAESGTDMQKDVNERINQIEEQSQMLQNANKVIASIASQTNLLAMNAAIEAAHAGEAGTGFSVVADEIRKLSETSTEQSKKISVQIKAIRGSIDGMVKASEKSTEAFVNVTQRIQETDDLVQQIKEALEEQNEGSQQINQALTSMNDTTVYVKDASSEMMESNRGILSEIGNLKNGAEVMAQKVDEMKKGAKVIHETETALSEISEKMQDSISEIGIQIDQFKV